MKAYVKPELFYERYELSQHVADCAIEWKESVDKNSCHAITDSSFPDGAGKAFFADGTAGCVTDFASYCYTAGTSGINTFVS